MMVGRDQGQVHHEKTMAKGGQQAEGSSLVVEVRLQTDIVL